MSFARPSLSDIVTRIAADIDSRLPGADAQRRRRVLSVLARTFGGAIDGLYGAIDDASRFLPDVADADRLARWASIFGLTRKAAEAASGTVVVAGSTGTGIPAGRILVRADGARYLSTAAIVIAGGAGALPVRAEGGGTAGTMAVGQKLTFQSPIVGIQAVATVGAGGLIGGADEESDAALRDRLLDRLRSPIRGGSASDYTAWATDVAGVTRAWTYENWNGPGTVKVLFVMDGRPNIIPAAGDVAVVNAYVAARRPVGAQVTVAGPAAAPLNLTIDITPDTPAVRAAVAAELADLISREAVPGGTLLISHIEEAISIAAGETDHVLTSPTANVIAAANSITTLGAITWS